MSFRAARKRCCSMKCAIIGCGRIALNHIKAVETNGLELAALCDIVPGKAEGLLERAGRKRPAPKCTQTIAKCWSKTRTSIS